MNAPKRTMHKHRGATVVTVDGFDVIECELCGFKHIMPLTSEEELKKFYAGEYYEQEKPDYFKHAEEDKEWLSDTYGLYYDLLEKQVSGRRLLDIGSGPGYFLDCGTERGWNVLGFEPSPAAAEYSRKRGLEVINDVFVQERAQKQGPYDVIALSSVLEHLRDPIRLLRSVQEILVPGGLLFVAVPNDFNPLQELLVEHCGYKPWWVVPRHHLNYFSIDSLSKLLTRLSLAPIEIGTTYPMEFFLLGGRNYVDTPMVGRACHAERKEFERNFFLYNKPLLWEYYKSLARQGIGRDAVLIAKK